MPTGDAGVYPQPHRPLVAISTREPRKIRGASARRARRREARDVIAPTAAEISPEMDDVWARFREILPASDLATWTAF